MKHIESNLKNIKRRIMLRVWYSYMLSLIVSPVTLVGMVLGISGTLFVQLVSLPNIFINLLNVRLGAVPEYIWQTLVNSAANGEFLKLVTLVLIFVSILYLRALLRQTPFSSSGRFIQST